MKSRSKFDEVQLINLFFYGFCFWCHIYKILAQLNVKPKPIKLLDEFIGENIFDIELGKDFVDMTPKAKTIKEQID